MFETDTDFHLATKLVERSEVEHFISECIQQKQPLRIIRWVIMKLLQHGAVGILFSAASIAVSACCPHPAGI